MKDGYGITRNDQGNRPGEFFRQLSDEAKRELEALQHVFAHPAGSILFSEKQAPHGILIVLEGEVKVSMNSSEGKRLILRIARAGDVLGLTATISGTTHGTTAEAIHPCKVAMVRRDAFLSFLMRHPEAYQSVAREVVAHYDKACEQLRTVGLGSSAPTRLARLILGWSENAKQTPDGSRLKISFTHEEISEFIGTTRETVTRTLQQLKQEHLVELHGSTWMIPNRVALENYAGL
jgi:CRP/FNR family transcriptional regulator, cyclic AMP receptor protein